MDIFISQLKRVTKVPIRKKNLKVNALSKSNASNALTDDLDHLEHHEQYFELSEPHTQAQDEAIQGKDKELIPEVNNQTPESSHEYIDVHVKADFEAYARKPRLSVENKSSQTDSSEEHCSEVKSDKNEESSDNATCTKHLDLYV